VLSVAPLPIGRLAPLVRDLDAHLRGVLGDKRATWGHQPRGAQGPLDTTTAFVSAQLAHDPCHVRRHVLDDPDVQLDRLDRRAIVNAGFAVQRLLDVVAPHGLWYVAHEACTRR